MAAVEPLEHAGGASPTAELALSAYETFAPVYDQFTADYEYDLWLAAIEDWARRRGLRGNQLLDVACGTGKSFLPMLARGFVVTACDLSPAMVAEARRKTRDVDVVTADMRALPWAAQFDLITCLDDAVNYLLAVDDLRAALESMAGALVPGGILVFDTNSLATYRSTFSEEFGVAHDGTAFLWRGEAPHDFRAGGICSATIDVLGPGTRQTSRHVQRHWPLEVLRRACDDAGFESVEFRGQARGGRLVGEPKELVHPKVVCLAKRAGDLTSGASAGSVDQAGPTRKEDPMVVKT